MIRLHRGNGDAVF